ncbi:transcription initiation factor IIA subunit 1 [Anopheles aquasalis]|uniref:transcription initiation factor IIA subunit 1 n=1 Tax=Anopheles aquasalis TaxID=42839 RepID=UPI00215B21B0|nr:transcription initiation factor IIA subunit 1 [Anopheles aquasalis]
MSLSQTSVLKVYQTVIDDVISGVRDAFLDEGVDEQVLQELKQIWTSKVLANKAIETVPDPQDQQPPSIVSGTKSVANKANGTKKAKAAAAAAAASASTTTLPENGKLVPIASSTSGQAASAGGAAKPVTVKPEPIGNDTTVSGSSSIGTASTATKIGNSNLPTTNTAVASKSNTVPAASTTSTGQQQSTPAAPAAVVASLDPNKLVAIQITLPAQPNGPNNQQRILTIQVPASALQENKLQQVLTSTIIASIMPLPPQIASTVLQQHVNSYLQSNNLNKLPIQKQLDGACDDDDMMEEESSCGSAIASMMVNANVDLTKPNQTTETDIMLDKQRKQLDLQLLNALSSNVPVPCCSSSKLTGGASRKQRRRPVKHDRKLEPSLDTVEGPLGIRLCSQLDGAVDTSDEEGSDISDDNIADDDEEDLDKEEEDDLDVEGGAEEEPLNSEDDVTDEDASDLFETDNVVVCQYDKITRSRNKWKFYLKDGIMHVNGKDFVFQKSNGDAEW